jgi:hypothetical protein
MLLLGVALTHLEMLADAFGHVHYLGVQVIFGITLDTAAAVAVIADDQPWIWMFTLAVGLANTSGYVLSRTFGLPLASPRIVGDWLHGTGLALGFLGLTLAGLASWVLLGRRSHARRGPVTSARDRALLPIPPPKRREQ